MCDVYIIMYVVMCVYDVVYMYMYACVRMWRTRHVFCVMCMYGVCVHARVRACVCWRLYLCVYL